MATDTKNPLCAMFGAFIQNERKKKHDISLEELCKRLNISTSLYKMIESGNAPFNSNRAFELIKVFPEANLEFNRLAKFFTGQSIVDQLINKNTKPKDAFVEIADNDHEFRELFQNVEEYFKYSDGSKEQKEFLQTTVVSEMAEFLSNAVYPEKSEDKFESTLMKALLNVPSLSLEIIVDVIQSYAKIIPQHFGSIAADWEKENKENFKSVCGFYISPDLIVNKDNLKTYTYPFLQRNNFESLRYVFISTEKDRKKLEGDFKTLLSKSSGGDIDKGSLSKVSFKVLSPSGQKYKSQIKRLLTDPKQADKELQAFWVFTTMKGNQIAFVGVKNGDVNSVYNLSYQEAIDRSKLFEKVWDSIEG